MQEFITVFKRYSDFSGRSTRKEYWMFQLIAVLIMFGLSILSGVVDPTRSGESASSSSLNIVVIVFFLAIVVPALAVSVRRLHDTGRSGWWLLFSLIPFIGGLVVFIFTVLDSQPGDNAYGPNPKGVPALNIPSANVQ